MCCETSEVKVCSETHENVCFETSRCFEIGGSVFVFIDKVRVYTGTGRSAH